MKVVRWSEKKNQELQENLDRQISFEDVFLAMQGSGFSRVEKHYNIEKYPHQKILFIEIRHYIYIVPFVEDDEEIFLKTIIPSRKYTKIFLQDKA